MKKHAPRPRGQHEPRLEQRKSTNRNAREGPPSRRDKPDKAAARRSEAPGPRTLRGGLREAPLSCSGGGEGGPRWRSQAPFTRGASGQAPFTPRGV